MQFKVPLEDVILTGYDLRILDEVASSLSGRLVGELEENDRLRNAFSHFGPIDRFEVDLKGELSKLRKYGLLDKRVKCYLISNLGEEVLRGLGKDYWTKH